MRLCAKAWKRRIPGCRCTDAPGHMCQKEGPTKGTPRNAPTSAGALMYPGCRYTYTLDCKEDCKEEGRMKGACRGAPKHGSLMPPGCR